MNERDTAVIKQRMYAIYDSKGGYYMPPFLERNNATALRAFTKAVQQEGTPFNQFASDYTLFCIAEWDDLMGRLIPLHAHESLGCAIEYLNREL